MRLTSNTARWLTGCGGLGIGLAALTFSTPARTDEGFTLSAEPAVALWLDDPQGERFTPGGYIAIRPGIKLGSVVGLQWSYAFLGTPAQNDTEEFGTANFFLAGLRVHPFGNMNDGEGILPGLFVDGNIGYVRTGPLDRAGFDAGLGLDFDVSERFSLGPVVRYGQVIQPDKLAGYSPHDAQFLTIGVDFTFGPKPHEETTAPEPKDCPEAEECPEVKPAAPVKAVDTTGTCKDGDADGVCDDEDRCPTAFGPVQTLGCPIDPCGGKPLIVLVQFPFDSATLPAPRDDNPQTMDPVLDAVARAIAQDPTCRVCVMGHTSEEGNIAHNEDLSRDRSAAVQGYLAARGITKSKIPTIGMGARCQLVPERSLVLNRRVEFLRLGEGDSCPTTCVP